MGKNYLKIVAFSFSLLVSAASFYEVKSMTHDPNTIFELQPDGTPRIKIKRATGADLLHANNTKGGGTTIALISAFFSPSHMEQYNQQGILHPAAFRDKTILTPEEQLDRTILPELKQKKQQLYAKYIAASTPEEKERISVEINDFADLYLKKAIFAKREEESREWRLFKASFFESLHRCFYVLGDSPRAAILDFMAPEEAVIFSEGDNIYYKAYDKEKMQIFKATAQAPQGLDPVYFERILESIREVEAEKSSLKLSEKDPAEEKRCLNKIYLNNRNVFGFQFLVQYLVENDYVQLNTDLNGIENADVISGSVGMELLHSMAPNAKLLPLDLLHYGAHWKIKNEKITVSVARMNLAKVIRKAIEEEVDVIWLAKIEDEYFKNNEFAKQETINAFKEATEKGISIVLPATYEYWENYHSRNGNIEDYIDVEIPDPNQPTFLDEVFDDKADRTVTRFEKQLFDELKGQGILFVGKMNHTRAGEEVFSKITQHPRQNMEPHFLLTTGGKIPVSVLTSNGFTEEPEDPSIIAAAGLALLKGHVKSKNLQHTSEDLIKILHDSGHDLAHDTPDVPFTSYKVLDLPNAIKRADESLTPKPIEQPPVPASLPESVVVAPTPAPTVSVPTSTPIISTPTPVITASPSTTLNKRSLSRAPIRARQTTARKVVATKQQALRIFSRPVSTRTTRPSVQRQGIVRRQAIVRRTTLDANKQRVSKILIRSRHISPKGIIQPVTRPINSPS